MITIPCVVNSVLSASVNNSKALNTDRRKAAFVMSLSSVLITERLTGSLPKRYRGEALPPLTLFLHCKATIQKVDSRLFHIHIIQVHLDI